MDSMAIKAFGKIQNKCLSHALDILDDEYELDNGGIDIADQLVGIAIAIEDLGLRWAAQHPLNKLL